MLNLCTGRVCLESWLERRLPWPMFFMVFINFHINVLWQHQTLIMTVSFQLLSSSLVISSVPFDLIQSASKMPEKSSGESFLALKEGKMFTSIHVFAWPQHCIFLCVRTLKNPSIFSSSCKVTLYKYIFIPPKSFTATPGLSKECNSPPIRCVHACPDWGEDILCICCELWLDKQKESDSYYIGNVYLNVLHELQVKYYIVKVFIVECNLSVKLKNNLFPDNVHINFFLCFDAKNSLLKFVQAY